MSGFSRAERGALLPIFLIVLVDIVGMTIILPLLPFYSGEFGATPQVFGLLVATYAVCQLVSSPLLGQLADRTGRKPLLLVSQIGTFVGFLVLANATSLWMVFASRLIDGSTAGNISLAQAYVSDVTSKENRARAFGLTGIAFGIGFLVGPAISGYLSQFGHRYPIYAALGLSGLSIIATATLLPRAHPAAMRREARPLRSILPWSRYREYFARPGLGTLLFQFFAFAFAFASFTSGFALYAERQLTWHDLPFGPQHVGYVLAYGGFLGIVLQAALLGRLVQSLGERRLARAGFVSLTLSYGLLGLIRSVPPLLASVTLSAFGQGVLRPTLIAQISNEASRDEQGVVLGLTQSIMSFAQIVAPLIAGFFIDRRLMLAWGGVAGASALFGLALNSRQPVAARTIE